jgi:C4-dicarboxylate transporter, DctM subunit
MELIALVVTFVVTLALGLPIYAVLGLSVIVYFGLTGINPVTIPHRMFAGLDIFVLLAVPFFMLAGNLMNAGGTTRRLVALADAMVGWLRGGLAYVNVVVSMLFAGISGSAAADTSAVGSIMIRAMSERGYTVRFATAVTVASSTIGPDHTAQHCPGRLCGGGRGVGRRAFLAGFVSPASCWAWRRWR